MSVEKLLKPQDIKVIFDGIVKTVGKVFSCWIYTIQGKIFFSFPEDSQEEPPAFKNDIECGLTAGNNLWVCQIKIDQSNCGCVVLRIESENDLFIGDLIVSMLSSLAKESWRRKALCDETLDRYRELNLIYRVSEKISSCLDVKKLAEITLQEASEALSADKGWIKIKSTPDTEIDVFYQIGFDDDESGLSMWLGKEIDKPVIDRLEPIFNNEMNDLFNGKYDFGKGYSVISVPLTFRGEFQGVITLLKEVAYFAFGDLKLLNALANQTSVAISNAWNFGRLEEYQKDLQEKNDRLIRINANLQKVLGKKESLWNYSLAIKQYITSSYKEMLNVLEDLVNIQSGTHNHLGLVEMGNHLRLQYKSLGFKEIPLLSPNPHLAFESSAINIGRPIILSGHIDTVFPADTSFNKFNKGKITSVGPGVVDMKGGIVVFLFALKALHHIGAINYLPIRVIHECNEEIGLPDAKTLYPELIKDAKLAFIGEEAGDKYELVTERRGAAVVSIRVLGKAAHSGVAAEAGVNAIEELMFKINLIARLNNALNGVSVNIGQINGGVGVNTIADNAVCNISVRFQDINDGKRVLSRIEEIATRSYLGNTQGSFVMDVFIPPMLRTSDVQSLFSQVKEIGTIVGQDIREETRGGASSACYLNSLGIPTLDGFGPRGGKDHTHEEFLYNDSLIDRSVLLAMAILYFGME